MLSQIEAKRAVLIAQREQLIGQVNMTNGAIAICDELIQDCFRWVVVLGQQC